MQNFRTPSLSTTMLVLVAFLLTGCSEEFLRTDTEETRAATPRQALAKGAPVADLSGSWSWQEEVLIKLPSELAMAIFGISESEGPVMNLTCHSWGALTLVQNGATFTGTATQTSSCETQGGQTANTPPFPPGFSLEGHITGRAVRFNADVGEGFYCPYTGTLTVDGGRATHLNATGRCDVPAPVHPNATKSLSFDATRL
jgi:hypothetical protein